MAIRSKAQNVDTAVRSATNAASALAMIISFCVNAVVEPPAVHVVFNSAEGLSRREFMEVFVPAESGHPRMGRWIDADSLFAFGQAAFASPEAPRFFRALAQYQAALRYWNTGSRVLVLAHLYIACEVLTKAVQRVHQVRLGLTEEQHAQLLGVDITKKNWRMMAGAPRAPLPAERVSQLVSLTSFPAACSQFRAVPSGMVTRKLFGTRSTYDQRERTRYGIFGKTVARTSPTDVGWWRYRVPGRGQIDWNKIIDALYTAGYDGDVAVEHEDAVLGRHPGQDPPGHADRREHPAPPHRHKPRCAGAAPALPGALVRTLSAGGHLGRACRWTAVGMQSRYGGNRQ